MCTHRWAPRVLFLALLLQAASPWGPLAAQEDPLPGVDSSAVPVLPRVEPPAFQALQDSAATAQLRALFNRIEELRQVQVDVDAGVAALTGRALTPEARDTAAALARGRPGVLYVVDGMEVETSVSARLAPVFARLTAQGMDWLAALPLLVVAAVVFAVFALLSGWAASWGWLYHRFGSTPLAEDLARRAVRLGFLLVGLLLALEILDATALVGAVLGAAGVMGIALGFAFRNIAENWLAGVLLSVRRPFAPNDEVSIGGNVGKVVRLTNSDTVLMTVSGNHLRIPNASVFNGVVENFTRNPLRRFTLRLTVPRDTSVGQARAALTEAVGATPGVLADPPAVAHVTEVGDAHLALDAHGWVDQHHADFVNTRGLAYRRAKEALENAGIPGPFSEHTIYMGPEDSPGSAAFKGAEAPEQDEAEEMAAPDPTVERQVAEDRAKSDEADLLRGT